MLPMCRDKSMNRFFVPKIGTRSVPLRSLDSGFRRKDGNVPLLCHTGASRYPELFGQRMDSVLRRKDRKFGARGLDGGGTAAFVQSVPDLAGRGMPGLYTARNHRHAGFSIISAIFLLVVLSALGAFIVNISSGQHVSAAADVQGARAYQAARAGVEWGAYQVLDPNGTAAVATPAACPATTTFMPFAGFTTSVTCVLSAHTENGNNIGVYRFTSTATAGTAGTINYVARVLDVTVAKCKDPAAVAPFNCE